MTQFLRYSLPFPLGKAAVHSWPKAKRRKSKVEHNAAVEDNLILAFLSIGLDKANGW